MTKLRRPFLSARLSTPNAVLLVGWKKGTALTELEPKRTPLQLFFPPAQPRCPLPALTATPYRAPYPPSLSTNTSRFPTALPHTTTSSSPSEAMTPAKIAVLFFVISSLLFLSHAGFVPDDTFPFTAVSKQDPSEDTDRTATVVPLEKSRDGSISASVEPFHRVDLSLRRPVNRHFPLRLRRGCHGHRHGRLGGREIPYGDDMIGFPRGPQMERGFPGEMRSIPMRGPRIPRGFPGEMRSIPMRGPQIPGGFPGGMRSIPMKRPEFRSGFWKDRTAMVHGMRGSEGREVSMEDKVGAKREEEREEGDFVKRFWAIVNRF